MTDQSIREAVGILEGIKRYNPNGVRIDKGIDTMLDLAQQYLDAGEMVEFEQFLMEKHAEQYIGTKDCMIDDFNKWVQDLGCDEFIGYGEMFRSQCLLILVKKEEELKELREYIKSLKESSDNASKMMLDTIERLTDKLAQMSKAASVESIEKVLQELAEKQMRAVVKAVNKKGLMKTGWGDIDNEGGQLDFKIISQAIHKSIVGGEE